MVFCTLILRPRVNRIANIALSIMYTLTIIAGAIGEWNYYILGSAIEVALLAAIVYYAWTWPKETGSSDSAGCDGGE
jgi:predicted ferric reductase